MSQRTLNRFHQREKKVQLHSNRQLTRKPTAFKSTHLTQNRCARIHYNKTRVV